MLFASNIYKNNNHEVYWDSLYHKTYCEIDMAMLDIINIELTNYVQYNKLQRVHF